MANDKDLSFYFDQYDRYFLAAQSAQRCGAVETAKKNYRLAAKMMLEIAKNSSDKLKQARLEKAKKLIEIADGLNESNCGQKHINKSSNNSGQADTQENDSVKQWKSAEIPNIHFSDIAGLDDVKESIKIRMINPILFPDKYALYKKKTGGGVLLYGPPGTGKTMIAKAIACEVGAKFYAVKSSDIVSKWVGESEKNIASLFECARNDSRAVIFIDEMDSLFASRGEDTHNDKRVNEFLQQIDGFSAKNPNLLLLGATNRPWDVDSAAVRSGRFSEKIYVHLPDYKARKYLIEKNLNNIPLAFDVNSDELAKKTRYFSGADIDEIVDRAKTRALNESIRTGVVSNITQNDFINAIESIGSSLDMKALKEFENYALRNGETFDFSKDDIPSSYQNINNVQEVQAVQKQEPQITVEKENNKVIVEFKQKDFVFVPEKKYVLEFSLSKDFDKVYLKIDGKNLLCQKEFKSWITDEFNVGSAGIFGCELTDGHNYLIIRTDITFTSGIEENDLGI